MASQLPTAMASSESTINGLSDQLSMLYSEREQSLSDQLSMLYSEREKLEEVLGVSNVDDVISLVKSFEDQLASFYSQSNHSSHEDQSHEDQSHEDQSHEDQLDFRALAVELVRLRTQNEAANLALLRRLVAYIVKQDQGADA